MRYDAFGNVGAFIPDGQGGWASADNTSGPRYRGQMYDAGTEKLYLRHRFYTHATGRFGRLDPIGLQGGLNMYGYAGADPVGGWDPWGLSVFTRGLKEVATEGSEGLIKSAIRKQIKRNFCKRFRVFFP